MSKEASIIISLSEYNRLIASDKALHEGKMLLVTQFPYLYGHGQYCIAREEEEFKTPSSIIQSLSDVSKRQNEKISKIKTEKDHLCAELRVIMDFNWLQFIGWKKAIKDKY